MRTNLAIVLNLGTKGVLDQINSAQAKHIWVQVQKYRTLDWAPGHC